MGSGRATSGVVDDVVDRIDEPVLITLEEVSEPTEAAAPKDLLDTKTSTPPTRSPFLELESELESSAEPPITWASTIEAGDSSWLRRSLTTLSWTGRAAAVLAIAAAVGLAYRSSGGDPTVPTAGQTEPVMVTAPTDVDADAPTGAGNGARPDSRADGQPLVSTSLPAPGGAPSGAEAPVLSSTDGPEVGAGEPQVEPRREVGEPTVGERRSDDAAADGAGSGDDQSPTQSTATSPATNAPRTTTTAATAPSTSAPPTVPPTSETPTTVTTTTTTAAAGYAGQTLDGVNFAGQNLAGVDFSGATLTGVDFSGANLRGAVFAGATMTDVAFRGVDLTGATLSSSSLDRVSFNGANISGVDFTGAVLHNGFIEGYWFASNPPINPPSADRQGRPGSDGADGQPGAPAGGDDDDDDGGDD